MTKKKRHERKNGSEDIHKAIELKKKYLENNMEKDNGKNFS